MTPPTPHPIVAFAGDVLRFPLYPRQAEILDEIYRDGIRTAVLRLGRRSGKGRIAAIAATYEATANAAAHLAAVGPGEQVAIVVIGRSQKQARSVHRYIATFLRAEAFGELVIRDTQDEIELRNGIVIRTMPCHAASVRGDAVAVVILDEAAWWTGLDGSPLDPKEIWDAIVPATAQFPRGRVLVLSTPRFPIGWFAELCDLASGGNFADLRHWHASTAEMNPAIPVAFLDQERAKDPGYFAREYLAEFAEGLGAVFDASLIRAAIRDELDLGPQPGRTYLISVDAAFTGDAFAALVGHREAGRTIVDRVRGWKGTRANPVQVDPVLDEIAAMSVAYGYAAVLIDQYAAQPIRQALRSRGIRVIERPWTNESKVDATAAVRRALYAKALEIPRHHELVAELASIEQRYMPSGRPRIAAPGRSHDDYATALMALVRELARQVVRTVGDIERRPDGTRRTVWRRQFSDVMPA